VKSASLNGELAKEVYVQESPDFAIAGCKALYGLCQAPRAWNTKLDASLVSLGFTKCTTEHALYAKITACGGWSSGCTSTT
jgi:hypothetical protein